MLLDRQEKHVLRELKSRYGIPTHKLASRIATREFGVVYDKEDPFRTMAEIRAYCFIVASGKAITSQKDIESPKIGRMVAFSRAVVDWYNSEYKKDMKLSGKEAENIARGVTVVETSEPLQDLYEGSGVSKQVQNIEEDVAMAYNLGWEDYVKMLHDQDIDASLKDWHEGRVTSWEDIKADPDFWNITKQEGCLCGRDECNCKEHSKHKPK